jgi:hypothetical protein
VVLIGVSILAGAKALLIQFVAHLLKYLQEGSWCVMGGVRNWLPFPSQLSD